MQHDNNIYYRLLALENTAFITGSFLVDKDLANDIDIVILFSDDLYIKLGEIGFVQTNKDEYLPDPTLLTTWRLNDYNLIIVKDEIALALWRAFSYIIADVHTYDFSAKEARIKLHEKIKKAYLERNIDDTKNF